MVLFSLVTVLFFLWGMSNNLTDILVQQFKKSFELSPFSAQLVPTANFTGLFCDGDAGGAADAEVGIQGRDGDGAVPVWRRDDSVLAGGGEPSVSAVSGGAVYSGQRGFVSGDGVESVYCTVWAGGDVRARG